MEYYIASGEKRAAKSLELLSSGNSVEAEKLLAKWEDIGLDDRYYKHKRTILLSLSNHLFENGEYRKAINFISTPLSENDRDITLFIEWAKSALNIPDQEEAAKRELMRMTNRFPNHIPLKKIYIKDVLFKNDEAAGSKALSEAIANLKEQPPKTVGWSISWNSELNKKYKKRIWTKLLSDGNRWSLHTTIPKASVLFRVDFPPYVRMDISGIQISSKEQSTNYSLSDLSEVGKMKIKENSLSAHGLNYPYFIIPAPDWLSSDSNEGSQEMTFSFTITNVGPDGALIK